MRVSIHRQNDRQTDDDPLRGATTQKPKGGAKKNGNEQHHKESAVSAGGAINEFDRDARQGNKRRRDEQAAERELTGLHASHYSRASGRRPLASCATGRLDSLPACFSQCRRPIGLWIGKNHRLISGFGTTNNAIKRTNIIAELTQLLTLAHQLRPEGNPLVELLGSEIADTRFYKSLPRSGSTELFTATARYRAIMRTTRAEQPEDVVKATLAAMEVWEHAGADSTSHFGEMLVDLTGAYLDAGDLGKAVKAADRAITLLRRRQGESPSYASALVLRSSASFASGQWVNAYKDAAEGRRVMIDYSRLTGKVSPPLCDCLTSMCAYMMYMDDPRMSQNIGEEALEAIESAFGRGATQEFAIREFMARMACEAGDYEKAEHVLAEMVRDLARRGDEYAFYLVQARVDLARVYSRTGRAEEAERIVKASFSDLSTVVGVHERQALGRSLLSVAGEVYAAENQFVLADVCLKESIVQWEKANGQDDPGLSKVLKVYARVLRRLDRIDEARKLENRAVECDRRIAMMHSEIVR